MADFNEISDRELLERIHAAQLKMCKDVEAIMQNMRELKRKSQPEVRNTAEPDFTARWRHLGL